MATKQLSEKQARAKFIKVLEANEGTANAATMLEQTGFDAATVNKLAKALIGEGVIKAGKNSTVVLVVEETPAVKAPAKGKVAPPKGKKAPELEEFDLDGDEEDEADSEEDAEFELDEEDDDEGLDDDGDEGLDDDEEEAPKPKAKGKKGGVSLGEAHQEFSMPFKPIDTLTDEELTERIENAVAAAESLNDQGHELVAEMLMRSVAKARRQLNKRG